MISENFNHTIDIWISAIQQYNLQQLCAPPDANNWSLGQVCIHLLNDTNWFIEQIKICLLNDDNAGETMSQFAQSMFIHNSLPDEKLTNPANVNMRQPTSKTTLLNSFINLKNDLNNVAIQINNSTSKGKTKHPGFGYFNATEWLQFADMHMRHHLKQKANIAEYLNTFKNSRYV